MLDLKTLPISAMCSRNIQEHLRRNFGHKPTAVEARPGDNRHNAIREDKCPVFACGRSSLFFLCLNPPIEWEVLVGSY